MKASLPAGQPVVIDVPVNGRTASQPTFHRMDGCRETRVVTRNETGEPDKERGGVKRRVIKGRGERTRGLAPAVFKYVGGDVITKRNPFTGLTAGERLRYSDRAIDSDPAHYFRMNMLVSRTTDFPNAVIGLLPTMSHGLDDSFCQSPMLGRKGHAAVSQDRQELHDRAEDVQLKLLPRGVADAHRSTRAIPVKFSNLSFDAEMPTGH